MEQDQGCALAQRCGTSPQRICQCAGKLVRLEVCSLKAAPSGPQILRPIQNLNLPGVLHRPCNRRESEESIWRCHRMPYTTSRNSKPMFRRSLSLFNKNECFMVTMGHPHESSFTNPGKISEPQQPESHISGIAPPPEINNSPSMNSPRILGTLGMLNTTKNVRNDHTPWKHMTKLPIQQASLEPAGMFPVPRRCTSVLVKLCRRL